MSLATEAALRQIFIIPWDILKMLTWGSQDSLGLQYGGPGTHLTLNALYYTTPHHTTQIAAPNGKIHPTSITFILEILKEVRIALLRYVCKWR